MQFIAEGDKLFEEGTFCSLFMFFFFFLSFFSQHQKIELGLISCK